MELRAAVVIGSGSISFEMLRYLTERLPFMVCPRWVRTRIQPIAARDLVNISGARSGDARDLRGGRRRGDHLPRPDRDVRAVCAACGPERSSTCRT